ncbi:MAG TPA: tRNA (guanosine(46)-N7)-methyltransferase TrmB [Bacteroidia bacterium]|jgi:tRNA (guanine-N7-)-methyltransferase|nr:tRNA (guanosine(46)-N7)-methyltransferase TrmB [Bacteroidia bacterium]
MYKNKLTRFAEMKTMDHVVEYGFYDLKKELHPLRGKWNPDFFGNDHPLILELGCGKGEYTVGLAERFPEKNFIGIDVKGARMHRGASKAIEQGMKNVGFLRTRIDFINGFFAPGEVDEIWLTFSDPQKEKPNKRLTAPVFLKRYANILKEGGIIHLKTDSVLLHEYTMEVIAEEGHEVLYSSTDIYVDVKDEGNILTTIQTTYEKKFLAENKKITYVTFRLKKDYGKNEKVFPL